MDCGAYDTHSFHLAFSYSFRIYLLGLGGGGGVKLVVGGVNIISYMALLFILYQLQR
jgi:hypothetical protein